MASATMIIKMLAAVKNGEPCGTLSANLAIMLLDAAFVLLTARMACLILEYHARSKPTEEAQEYHSSVLMMKKRAELCATHAATVDILEMALYAGADVLMAKRAVAVLVSTVINADPSLVVLLKQS
jgi:hypothetical protein